MLDGHTLPLLRRTLDRLHAGFTSLPEIGLNVDIEELERVLMRAAERMQDNYPYFHPLYAGQMLKPPHPVARIAYALSLWINPNNHALDGGRASSAMEHEAVKELATMFGWNTYLGHLCGGGTMANLEALWVAREVTGGKGVAVSAQAHYTHQRLSGVLGMRCQAVAVDAHGRMSVDALRSVLDAESIGTVVATLGVTGTGAVDPLEPILDLCSERGVRVHVDAAYGGYFKLASNLGSHAQSAFEAIHRVDSIVIDPHKHGLQPYGCGCVLFADPEVGRVYHHESPVTYFTSDELHLGEISLECSRPGATAVALWATQQLLPYVHGGEFAHGLEACRRAALNLYHRLEQDDRWTPLLKPDLDIVVWAANQPTASAASAKARAVFRAAADLDLHLALAGIPRDLAAPALPNMEWDQDAVTCLRSVLMKPEHETSMNAIWERLQAAEAAVPS